MIGTRKAAPYYTLINNRILQIYAFGIQIYWDKSDIRGTKMKACK